MILRHHLNQCDKRSENNTDHKTDDRQEATKGLEGKGADMIHAHGLGDKGRAPNNSGKK